MIILTFTPRFSALRIVSALSCLGGSKSGIRPMKDQGPPGLSFLPSGTSWKTIEMNYHQKYGQKYRKEASPVYNYEKQLVFDTI